jgi:hypothetical protein
MKSINQAAFVAVRSTVASATLVIFMNCTFMNCLAIAQGDKDPYPKMAPQSQYLMDDRNAEITLARSAAPASISREAEVLVLEKNGYHSAGKGSNGFVCLVQRSWAASLDDPEFWNPKLRSPICLNPAAARSFLPHVTMKAEWALAGLSKPDIAEKVKLAFQNKDLVSPEPGAMCYMMSKQGYLGDRVGHWHPHLMFFTPPVDPAQWGAGLDGSPMLGSKDSLEQYSLFMLTVGKWSDGTADQM